MHGDTHAHTHTHTEACKTLPSRISYRCKKHKLRRRQIYWTTLKSLTSVQQKISQRSQKMGEGLWNTCNCQGLSSKMCKVNQPTNRKVGVQNTIWTLHRSSTNSTQSYKKVLSIISTQKQNNWKIEGPAEVRPAWVWLVG